MVTEETPKLNLIENFILRGQSYRAGMLLLVSHLTEEEWRLDNKFSARFDLISEQIDRLYKDYENDLKKDKGISFETAYAKLESLIASYISILDFHTRLSVPFQSLCVAERCAVWKKGRSTFVTQVPIVDSRLKSLNIAQSETPCIDKDILLQEMANLKTLWFELLPKWQQCFIKKNAEELSKQSIPSSLRSVAGLANVSMHRLKINDVEVSRNFRHATPAPIDLMAEQPSDELFRLTCLNLASQVRLSLDEQLKASGSLNQQELVILTQSLLSPGSAATFKAKYFTDASDNDTLLYEMKERIVELFQWALSNPNKQIAAKDAKIKALFFTEEEQLEVLYYKDFLAKFDLMVDSDGCIKYKPLKITLLSTNHPLNILRHFGVHPDQTKRNDFNTARLLNAVGHYLTPLLFKKNSTHPPEQLPALLNYIEETKRFDDKNSTLHKLIRDLDFYGRNKNSSAKKDKKELIKTLEDLLKKDALDKTPGFKQEDKFDKNTVRLLDALQALLSTPTTQGVFTADERHYQMLISSAEMVILNCISGIAWVACKSGKDRTGGALITNDAAAVFYELKKRHPRHDDDKQDRALYLELLKNFFESGHHQHVASENAPGAQGLVKFSNYAPSDLLNVKNIRLETQFARLNKPKNIKISYEEPFNQRILKDELRSLKDKTIKITIGQNVTLDDWSRNWEIYFINGKSVKELRNNKGFKNEKDLSEFMATYLLAEITDQELKKYYLALALYSFHQGGFLHAFSSISTGLINDCYRQQNQEAIIGQPNMRINLSWVEGRGIQIEEINTYKEKKYFNKEDPIEEGDYCQTYSCVLLNLKAVKDKGYKLAVNIQNAYVNCTETLLKRIFFSKKTNLLEAFIHFLQSLLVAIKRCFDKLVKPYPVLDESWISKTNATFFKKSTETTVNEERNVLQCDPSVPVFL